QHKKPTQPLAPGCTSGGKRLRGFLVLQSAALHDIVEGDAIWAAAAIEALHGYSLVHDDLPCMDDDDLRRGQPTVHKKWDEATAVLVGDALQSFAFEVLGEGGLPADRKLDLSVSLASASGAAGMVLGQALDIAAETAAAPLDLHAISDLQAGKTGALIEWSACAGARMADADIGPLKAYAEALGLAFQIADDILDVEGDEAKTGKRVGKDEDAGKATFVSLMGLDAARAKARALVSEAIEALGGFDARAEHLRDAARFVISRDF
ncbi:MAG: polyprenyl synthetase family protein, partial [Pseudomonadota bacterium]